MLYRTGPQGLFVLSGLVFGSADSCSLLHVELSWCSVATLETISRVSA